MSDSPKGPVAVAETRPIDRLTDPLPLRESNAMNEQDFQKKLGDLMGEISTLPKSERDKLEALARQTKDRHRKLKKTVGELQESLDYLRLSIKYLVFDLEATRRENGYLRKMLEEQDTPGDRGPEVQELGEYPKFDIDNFEPEFGDDDEDDDVPKGL